MRKLKNEEFVNDPKLEKFLKEEIKKKSGSSRVLISMKIDARLLERIKKAALKEGIGYQTLIHSHLTDFFSEDGSKDQTIDLIEQISLSTNLLRKAVRRKMVNLSSK